MLCEVTRLCLFHLGEKYISVDTACQTSNIVPAMLQTGAATDGLVPGWSA
jgi:hypothetical protein